MHTATSGTDILIVGRGATEATAWSIAKRVSRRRQRAIRVIHPHNGDYHAVTGHNGQPMGHQYRVGGQWWTAKQTIQAKAAALRRQAVREATHA